MNLFLVLLFYVFRCFNSYFTFKTKNPIKEHLAYEKAKGKYDALVTERNDRMAKAKAIERFMQTVASRDGLLAEFDPQLWLTTVEYVTVTKNGDLRFQFYDGTEVVT